MTTIDFSKVKSIGLNLNLLPEGYTEVAYIESQLPGGKGSSVLHVDTQVKNINGCRVKFKFNTTERDQLVFGVRTGWNGPWFGCALSSESNPVKFLVMPDRVHEFAADTNIHFVDNNCRKLGYCYVDDEEFKYDPSKQQSYWGRFATGENLWLFNDHSTPGGEYSAQATIYSAEFFQDQKLVCKPVPCVYHMGMSDATAGFYDLVNKRFITKSSDSTGKLVAGPVVNKSIVQLKLGDVVLWKKPLS